MRRFVCGVLAVCLLAGFCACGRGEVEKAIREYMSAQSMTTEATPTEVTTTEVATEEYTTEVWYTTDSFENESDLAKAIELFKEWYDTPKELTPYHHMETKRIHKDMQEYAFTILGLEGIIARDYVGSYGTVYGDYHGIMVYAIEIRDTNGKLYQRLDGFTTMLDEFSIMDFNNDGYLDLRLHACRGGSMRNEPSLFWLWDNAKQKFVRNEQLAEISQDWGISVENDGRIRCYTRAGAWGYGLLYFSYINGVFVEVEKVDVYPKDWNYIADAVFVRDTYKRINGEMKLVSTEELEDWTQ